MKIYSHVRLLAAEEKKVSQLSDSTLRKIANDSKDKRSNQAKKELERRTGNKSSSKPKDSKAKDTKTLDLMQSPVQKSDSAFDKLSTGYKKFDRWNTQRKINKLDREDKNDLRTDNWFFGPKESDFQGNKFERQKQLNDYINSRREVIRNEKQQLQEKLDRLNQELGN